MRLGGGRTFKIWSQVEGGQSSAMCPGRGHWDPAPWLLLFATWPLKHNTASRRPAVWSRPDEFSHDLFYDFLRSLESSVVEVYYTEGTQGMKKKYRKLALVQNLVSIFKYKTFQSRHPLDSGCQVFHTDANREMSM